MSQAVTAPPAGMMTSGILPAPHPKANKRTTAQKEQDRAFISRLSARGKSAADIAELLRAKRDYSLSPTQIQADLSRVREGWRQEAVAVMGEAIGRELEGLRQQEEELWEAWEKSKTKAVKNRGIRQLPSPGIPFSERQIVEEAAQHGDPRYMALILAVRKRRAELLGLDAPVRTEISGPGGQPLPPVAGAQVIIFLPDNGFGPAAVPGAPKPLLEIEDGVSPESNGNGIVDHGNNGHAGTNGTP